ncbi:MAG TPA: allantoate amidohydrolase [Candidatus Saccharimonadales bacterium]|nr:allantoate amidohydrolase [Candidatus Saccharimonadales bacterium]
METPAQAVIGLCRRLAEFTEEPGHITRTFLSAPMREVHRELRGRMEELGMTVTVDAAGNLRGLYPAAQSGAPRLLIASHLDSVPHAGAFDGVLGVVMGVALVDALAGRRMRFAIEVVGFSEEEGVRFGVPFIGSRALVGDLGGVGGDYSAALLERRDAQGQTVADAIRSFGLDLARLPEARLAGNTLGYLEFHIEQGPVLESIDYPLGIVEAISGQSRLGVCFTGQAGHAGTTPMKLRRDALAGTAEWITQVETIAGATTGLVATVGRLEIDPGAGNVIAGSVQASLDVRHVHDPVRHTALEQILATARQIALRRKLAVTWEQRMDQPAVAMNAEMTTLLEQAVQASGYPVHRMPSGAGHDAMILAAKVPAAMLFLRSPGGLSHHPDENVLAGDVLAALTTGLHFLDALENGQRTAERRAAP